MYDFHDVVFSFLCRSIEKCVLLPSFRLSTSVFSLLEWGLVLCSTSQRAYDTVKDSSSASTIKCHNLSSNSVKING